MKDEIVAYITDLVIASQNDPMLELGISPRGAIAISHMAKACALLNGRDYVTDDDVRAVFKDVCSHRVLLSQKARSAQLTADDVLKGLLSNTSLPYTIDIDI